MGADDLTATRAKQVDLVKMLAFERLMQQGATPLEIRGVLGLAESTYYLYLRSYRDAARTGHPGGSVP